MRKGSRLLSCVTLLCDIQLPACHFLPRGREKGRDTFNFLGLLQ